MKNRWVANFKTHPSRFGSDLPGAQGSVYQVERRIPLPPGVGNYSTLFREPSAHAPGSRSPTIHHAVPNGVRLLRRLALWHSYFWTRFCQLWTLSWWVWLYACLWVVSTLEQSFGSPSYWRFYSPQGWLNPFRSKPNQAICSLFCWFLSVLIVLSRVSTLLHFSKNQGFFAPNQSRLCKVTLNISTISL